MLLIPKNIFCCLREPTANAKLPSMAHLTNDSYRSNMDSPSGATVERDVVMLKTQANTSGTPTEKLMLVTTATTAVSQIRNSNQNIYQTVVRIGYG
jgi:hypothetical protein